MAAVRDSSIRTRIAMVTTLTVVLVALMLGGLYTYGQFSHIRNLEKRFLYDSVRSAAAISHSVMADLVSGNYVSMGSLASYYARRSSRLYVLVLDSDNRIVADSRTGRVGELYSAPLSYRTDKDGDGIIRNFMRSGRRAVEVSHPIRAGDLVVGSVVMGLNMQWLDEEKGIMTRGMILSTVIALAVILIGVSLASTLARRISEPLQMLTEAAERVGGGDYSQKIHIDSRDEVGRLADTFNAMVGELDSARAELVEKNLLEIRLRLANFAVSHTLRELMQTALDEVEALTGSTLGFYHFLEEDQKTLWLQAWSTNTLQGMCSAEGRERHYDLEAAGVWADCIRERRPVIHNDYRALGHRKGLPPWHVNVIRELAVPVFRGDRIVAILGVGNKPAEYDAKDLKNASRLADLAWDLVERKRTEDDLLASEEKYRSVVENVSAGIAVISPKMEILSVNNAMSSWFPDIDLPARPLCYRALYSPPRDEICSDCPTARTLADGEIHEAIAERVREGKTLNHRVLSSPIRDKAGNIVAAVEMVEDITERTSAEQALRASEARLREAQGIAHVGNWEWDILTGRIEWSEELYRIYGCEPHEVVPDFQLVVDAMHPKSKAAFVGAINAALKAGRPFEMDYTIFRMDGSEAVLHAIGQVQYDRNGAPARMMGTIQDITENKRAEEKIRASLAEKEILLKEIHHRVKNNLQVVASMLSLQSRYLEDQKSREMFDDSRRRIEAMSLIHEKLYRSKDLARIDFRQYVGDLVKNVTALNGGRLVAGRVVRAEIGEVRLDVNKGIPCGLIINELVSNAIRHAFPDGRNGEVVVKMQRNSGGRVSLVVSDNGVGFPGDLDFRATKSLGMQLVVSLVGQLDGDIELDRREGTAFAISFQA